MATVTPKQTYRTAIRCANCGYGPVPGSFEVGVPVTALECPACLCKTLQPCPDALTTGVRLA